METFISLTLDATETRMTYPGDRTAPKASLRLEWVYGYRAANCRSNVHLTESGELVYFSAAVAIVQSLGSEKDTPRQRFFLGHDQHIISSCLHPQQTIIATGQIGKNAQICLWNTQGSMKLESLLQGHAVGVGAMNFNSTGEVKENHSRRRRTFDLSLIEIGQCGNRS